jgi:hypothetical protein
MVKRTGSCRCGAISFAAEGEPVLAGHCHCLDCQKTSGGGHVSFAFFPANAVTISGEPKAFSVPADSGRTMTRQFCPECGSRLFGRSTSTPSLLGITLSVFDDPDSLTPTVSLFTSRLRRWDTIAANTRAFEEGPRQPG